MYIQQTAKPMYYFQIQCRPLPDNPYFKDIRGAYAAAYIDFRNLAGAYHLAEYFIQENGWKLLEVLEYMPLSSEDLDSLEIDELQILEEHGVFIKYVHYGSDNLS